MNRQNFSDQSVFARNAIHAFQALTVVQALLLLSAASLKAWSYLTDPFADIRIGLYSPAIFCTVILEFSSACYLLFGRNLSVKWLLQFCIFSTFAFIATARLLVGVADCGCLGPVELPGWILPLNTVIVLATLISLIAFSSTRSMFDIAATSTLIRKQFSTPELKGGIAAVLVFGLAIFVFYSWIQDKFPIKANSITNLQLVAGGSNQTSISLSNRSQAPVRVVGVSKSCECVVLAGDSSRAIGRLSSLEVLLDLRPRKPGYWHQRVIFFLDHPHQSSISVDLAGVAN